VFLLAVVVFSNSYVIPIFSFIGLFGCLVYYITAKFIAAKMFRKPKAVHVN
jgi:hypothetical protein